MKPKSISFLTSLPFLFCFDLCFLFFLWFFVLTDGLESSSSSSVSSLFSLFSAGADSSSVCGTFSLDPESGREMLFRSFFLPFECLGLPFLSTFGDALPDLLDLEFLNAMGCEEEEEEEKKEEL